MAALKDGDVADDVVSCGRYEVPWYLFRADCRALSTRKRGLYTLPGWIGFARHLRVLDISENKLAEIPAAVGLLVSLRELRAGFNSIAHCRFDLGQLRELVKVDLQKNRLKRLRYSMPHANMTMVLDGNPVTKLTWGLRHVRHLSLRRTSWTPCAPFLETQDADLAHCRVPTLRNLGAALRHLCLVATGLRNLDGAGDLPLLLVLRAGQNPGIDAVPPQGTLQHLSELHLSHCDLQRVPSELLGLPSLILLDVSSNQLTRLPSDEPCNAKLIVAAEDNPLEPEHIKEARCALRLDACLSGSLAPDGGA